MLMLDFIMCKMLPMTLSFSDILGIVSMDMQLIIMVEFFQNFRSFDLYHLSNHGSNLPAKYLERKFTQENCNSIYLKKNGWSHQI